MVTRWTRCPRDTWMWSSTRARYPLPTRGSIVACDRFPLCSLDIRNCVQHFDTNVCLCSSRNHLGGRDGREKRTEYGRCDVCANWQLTFTRVHACAAWLSTIWSFRGYTKHAVICGTRNFLEEKKLIKYRSVDKVENASPIRPVMDSYPMVSRFLIILSRLFFGNVLIRRYCIFFSMLNIH